MNHLSAGREVNVCVFEKKVIITAQKVQLNFLKIGCCKEYRKYDLHTLFTIIMLSEVLGGTTLVFE